MIEKIEAWVNTKRGQIITLSLSVGILLYLSLRGFYVRINTTGWENFPAVMLDYFAIIGGIPLLILAIIGIYGLVKLILENEKEESVRQA